MAFSAKDLHPRHRIFADEWLTGEHTGKPFNGRAAYEHAGYKLTDSNPSTNASKLLRHPKVAEYIKSRLEELGFSATEVMLRFADIARADVGEVVTTDPTGNHLKLDPKKVLEKARFIKSFGHDSQGQPKVEFHDSMRALENMARVLGMFKDGLELSGPGGGAIAHMKVEFVDSDGTGMDIGGEGPEEQTEDFSDFDNMDALLDRID